MKILTSGLDSIGIQDGMMNFVNSKRYRQIISFTL